MNNYELHPLDTLFFRDARPMTADAGSGGHGANWPLPTVIHEAMRARLLGIAGENRSGKTRRGHNGKNIMPEAFRSLRTIGALPCKKNTLYFPRPLDVLPSGEKATFLRPCADNTGSNNLPVKWLRVMMPDARPDKGTLPEWISQDAFVSLLQGKIPSLAEEKLFEKEHRIGIGIDPDSGSAAEGMLYTAEHLRLHDDVSLWCQASLSEIRADENRGQTLGALENQLVALGGESRLVRVQPSSVNLNIPPPRTRRIKWVLATHAVFRGGWRPNWIDEKDGKVLFKQGAEARKQGESRKDWRMRIRGGEGNEAPSIQARLVAAAISKPIHFSGWDLGEEGAKPTILAAPAGSVYFFEADTDEDAAALINALHGRTRSDFFGEKGMGLGFCGTWTDVAGRPMTGEQGMKEAN